MTVDIDARLGDVLRVLFRDERPDRAVDSKKRWVRNRIRNSGETADSG
jgi:hypothetical protein